MNARALLVRLVLAASAAGLAGCNGSPDTAATTAKPTTYTVTMEAVSYKPETVTMKVGDSIAWINKDPFPHTATAAGLFDSKEMAPEKSWTYTATTPGEVHYLCTFHPTMKGTIVVK